MNVWGYGEKVVRVRGSSLREKLRVDVFDFFDERTPREKKRAAAAEKDAREASLLAEKKKKTTTTTTKRSSGDLAVTPKTNIAAAAMLVPIGLSIAAVARYKLNRNHATQHAKAQQDWKMWTKTFAPRLHASLMMAEKDEEEDAHPENESASLMRAVEKKHRKSKKSKKLKRAERKRMEALTASRNSTELNAILDPVQDLKQYLKKK